MIRPLRQRHRVMMFALTVVVPAAFALGIATRRAVPAFTGAAPGSSVMAPNRTELWSRDDLWEKQSVRTTILKDSAKADRLAVVLIPKDQIVCPDVLVYWVPGERKIQDLVPDNAFLLGSFDQSGATPLELPAETANRPGVLLLYSLANHEIVAVSKPLSSL